VVFFATPFPKSDLKMKKKFRKSKNESDLTDEDSDSCSIESVASSAVSMSRQMSAVSIEDIAEALNQSINDIEAKRATSRETGLSRLIKLLTNRFLKNEISSSREQEILELLSKSIKRGGKECRLACQGLGLMFITMGESTSFQSLHDLLFLLVKNSDFDSETRAVCCSTLALLCWIQDVGNSTITGLLGIL
jgi:Interferon-related developmental regulator (IFRD)